jgi:hypothetical protein
MREGRKIGVMAGTPAVGPARCPINHEQDIIRLRSFFAVPNHRNSACGGITYQTFSMLLPVRGLLFLSNREKFLKSAVDRIKIQKILNMRGLLEAEP